MKSVFPPASIGLMKILGIQLLNHLLDRNSHQNFRFKSI